MNNNQTCESFQLHRYTGLAVDPIHVGTGGARLGRVDNTIVRDPATRLPKIPGSSLAGVLRTYVAMAMENQRRSNRQKPYYPDCVGQGQPRFDGSGGHCGQRDCEVCTVFGFARGQGAASGFAGLAAFSDMQLLLFPVATREGPMWVTSPGALRIAGIDDQSIGDENKVYLRNPRRGSLNLGWLLLESDSLPSNDLESHLTELSIPQYIRDHVALVSDKLFSHVVNSNLEVRTSVAIDPSTGAAQERALFTYEALPRASVLYWEVICRFPGHFQIGGKEVQAVKTPEAVHEVVNRGYPYLEALGIGGMGTRGMGRLRVLNPPSRAPAVTQEAQADRRE